MSTHVQYLQNVMWVSLFHVKTKRSLMQYLNIDTFFWVCHYKMYFWFQLRSALRVLTSRSGLVKLIRNISYYFFKLFVSNTSFLIFKISHFISLMNVISKFDNSSWLFEIVPKSQLNRYKVGVYWNLYQI